MWVYIFFNLKKQQTVIRLLNKIKNGVSNKFYILTMQVTIEIENICFFKGIEKTLARLF